MTTASTFRIRGLYKYNSRILRRWGLQEIGPRFTLKLQSVQKGTFDSLYGDYVWVHEVSVTPIMMEERSHCFLSHPSASKWILIDTCSKYTERISNVNIQANGSEYIDTERT